MQSCWQYKTCKLSTVAPPLCSPMGKDLPLPPWEKGKDLLEEREIMLKHLLIYAISVWLTCAFALLEFGVKERGAKGLYPPRRNRKIYMSRRNKLFCVQKMVLGPQKKCMNAKNMWLTNDLYSIVYWKRNNQADRLCTLYNVVGSKLLSKFICHWMKENWNGSCISKVWL